MGTDLHYSIPKFFEARMAEHSNVSSFRRNTNNDEIVYAISRIKQSDEILVWLSDEYMLSDFDIANRPKELKAGDYILHAKPEGGIAVSTETALALKLGVGRIGDFMGALNHRDMWTYVSPSYEEREARKKKWSTRGTQFLRKFGKQS